MSADSQLPVRELHPTASAAFLLRCSRNPERWFYPANAKSREPVLCEFHLLARPAAPTLAVSPSATPPTSPANPLHLRILECAYSEGGTGWRVWPCSLLLACYLASLPPCLPLGEGVLELGCGLGLPGMTAASLGGRVDLTDCLPRLLHIVHRSIGLSDLHSSCRALSLDWDEEAPLEGGGGSTEEYSTEQGVKAAQMAERAASSLNFSPVLGGEKPNSLLEQSGIVSASESLVGAEQIERGKRRECEGGPLFISSLERSTRYGLILASDVIYSRAHASQLPQVIKRRLTPGGQLCMMLPVRAQAHAMTFLHGLRASGMQVLLERVDAEWTARAISVQASSWKASIAACAAEPREAEEVGGSTNVKEGEVLFVQAFNRSV